MAGDGINYNNLWYQTPEMVNASNSQFALFEADRVSWEIQPKEVDPAVIADSLDVIWKRRRFAPIMVNQVPELNREEISTWYQKPDQFVKYKTTRCAWIRIKVWPDGSVRPCRNWQVGNMSQEDSMQVWNNEKFRAFRNHLAKGVLPICARCCYLGHR